MTKDDQISETAWARSGSYQRLLVAGHIDDGRLSERGQRVLQWLSESDHETIGGLEELLRLVRKGAECPHGFPNPSWCAFCAPVKDARDGSRR